MSGKQRIGWFVALLTLVAIAMAVLPTILFALAWGAGDGHENVCETSLCDVAAPGIVAFAQLDDGRAALALGGGKVIVWSPDDSSAPSVTLTTPRRQVTAIAGIGAGRIATSDSWGFVQVWDLADASEPSVEVQYQAHPRNLTALSNGQIASSTVYGVQVWGPYPSMEIVAAIEIAAGVSDVAELEDGRLMLPGSPAQIWNPNDSGGEVQVGAEGEEVVTPVADVIVLSDGRGASFARSGSTIEVWDPADPQRTEMMHDGHAPARVSAIVGLANSQVASVDNTGSIHVWSTDSADTALVRHLGAHMQATELSWVLAEGAEVSDLYLLSDDRIAFIGPLGVYGVWDPAAPDEVTRDWFPSVD